MLFAERVNAWNRRYDEIPEQWRFQFVLWSLLFLGTINMLLTLATRFPFGLLVLLGIIVVAAIRVPYVMGWGSPENIERSDSRFHIEGPEWVIDLNRRYEAMPESRRFWVYPAVLLIGGALNMILTISHGFPFGLLFLFTLLVLVLVRAPYTAGWLRPAEVHEEARVEPHMAEVEHVPMPVITSEPPVGPVSVRDGDHEGHGSPEEPS